MAEPISIKLTQDQALVLFERLAKRENATAIEPFLNNSLSLEDLILSDILCQLESELTQPFDPGYATLL